MTVINVLGIDPALRNTGLVRAQVNLSTLEIIEIESLDLVKTDKSKDKKVRRNTDDLDRCRDLYAGLEKALPGVSVVFAEIPVGSQSSRAMASYAACVMLLATIKQPLIQLSPDEVKVAAVGDKNATKRQMIEWAAARFPDADWLKARGSSGRLIDDNEHLADALAAIEAGLQTREFQGYLTILRHAVMVA